MSANNGALPGHVVQLDHAAAAVQHKPKCFHDGPSKQHWNFPRQQVHLDIGILATNARGQAHGPCAIQAGITTKVEGTLAPHELHLGDVVVGLFELEHVAQEGTIARQEGTCTRVQHGTVMAFTSLIVGATVLSVGAALRLVALPPLGTGLGSCVGHVTDLSTSGRVHWLWLALLDQAPFPCPWKGISLLSPFPCPSWPSPCRGLESLVRPKRKETPHHHQSVPQLASKPG